MTGRASHTGPGAYDPKPLEEAPKRRSKRQGKEVEDAVRNMNAHEMAEFFLSKFQIAPKVRKELDKMSKVRVGEMIASQRRINVDLIEPILAKKPWDRTWDQLATVHAEISKAHCFDKIHVSPDAEFDLCQVATLEVFPTLGTPIFREGDKGDKFYVLLEGSVYVESQAKGTLVTLFEGDSFGEIALLHESVRAATVYVEDACKLLSVAARDYERRIRPYHLIEENTKRREYNSIPAFHSMDPDSLTKLVNVTRIKRFHVATDIFKEGDIEHMVMFVIKGFVEAWKKIGDGRILYGTLGPGDSLDITKVVAGKKVSYTATAVAIVDVMAIARKDIVPPKESGVASLIDQDTMKKLLDRERRPPDEDQVLAAYAENEGLWKDYKDQLVSSVLWQNRFTKHLPKCGVSFNKYSQMKVRSDPKFQEHTLTENLASAALPTCFQDPHAEKRRNVLSSAKFGEKLMGPREFQRELSSALVQPGGGGRLKIEKAVAGMKGSARSTGISIRNGSRPIQTIAGTISQPFFKERRDSLKSPESMEAGELEPRKGFRKYIGPDERDSPPRRRPKRPSGSAGVWRYGASPEPSSPFAEPSKPPPGWGQRPERWILTIKEKEGPPRPVTPSSSGGSSRVWVPSGPSAGYHKHTLAAEVRAGNQSLTEELLGRPETAAAFRRREEAELWGSARPQSSRPWTPGGRALQRGGAFNEPVSRQAFTGRW